MKVVTPNNLNIVNEQMTPPRIKKKRINNVYKRYTGKVKQNTSKQITTRNGGIKTINNKSRKNLFSVS